MGFVVGAVMAFTESRRGLAGAWDRAGRLREGAEEGTQAGEGRRHYRVSELGLRAYDIVGSY